MASCRPVALTIAGSDNSSGAGIQADLKAFTALGVYGLTTITCVVAEIPGHVSAVAPVPPDVVAEQVRLSFSAYPVAAAKTGMLYSYPIINAVCDVLEALPRRPQLVVDPVMIASSGDPLLEPDAMQAYPERVFPLAALVTPNLDEASALAGYRITSREALEEAGRALSSRFGTAFLLKGGHLPGEAVDLLFTADGQVRTFVAPRVEGVSTHGTGCTFSAAITAGLARGLSLPDAVAAGKEYIANAITRYYSWPSPSGGETHALNHEHGSFRDDGRYRP